MHRTLLIIAGGALTALTGCHSYPHYGSPAYQSAPAYNMAPQPAYGPGTYGPSGGTFAPSGGQYLGPPSGGPYPTPNGNTYAPSGDSYVPGGVPNGGPTPLSNPAPLNSAPPGNAPAWRPDNNPPPTSTFDPAGAPANDRLVPAPIETDGNLDFGPPPSTNRTNDGAAPFPRTSQAQPQRLPYPVRLDPPEIAPAPINAAPGNEVAVADELFEPPTPIRTASDSRAGAVPFESSPNHRPNPYDYDRQGYSWLRGTVDYDPTDQTWNIIYNLKPEGDDELGGSVTLLVGQHFAEIPNGAVVYVSGRVDPAVRDRAGKPMFRVDQAKHLKPRQS